MNPCPFLFYDDIKQFISFRLFLHFLSDLYRRKLRFLFHYLLYFRSLFRPAVLMDCLCRPSCRILCRFC